MIGSKLAHYDITSRLGSGGMGEVYQAIDSKLGRSVAIKLLPTGFATDADRLSRFRREAQVLASLNHPNIAQIYGLEESGETRFIVMELVEGETLQARLQKGPIPVDEALTIATQIADALGAAHEKGVVHRDLKPGNVMLTKDGKVKVLDFGLAKASEARGSSGNLSNSPTLETMAATNAGVILGTAAYMSPEQARGRVVDKRADIFSFGAVLFEMVTGRRAFAGEDLTDTLAAIVKMDPQWDFMTSGVPARIQKIVRLCLRKDPRQRLQDIGDVRLALEGEFETASGSTISDARSKKSSRRAWIATAAAAAAIIALAIPATRHFLETRPLEIRSEIVTPPTDSPAGFALSPNGEQIVFAASDSTGSHLWLRSLATTTAQPLAGTEGALLPFWSPDSRSVGFFAAGSLKRLDLAGGAPRVLAPALSGTGGTWNADGIIVFAPSVTSALMQVPASGGTPSPVTQLGPQQSAHIVPFFFPDGKRFLFFARGAPGASGIYVGNLDKSAPLRLVAAETAAIYSPEGWIFWARSSTLVAQRLDLSQMALKGEPFTVADGVVNDGRNANALSVSASGLIAYRTGESTRRQLTWFDRTGMSRGLVGQPDSTLYNLTISPDGKRVLAGRTVQGNTDIWLMDGARTSRVTFDAAVEYYPLWAPDNAHFAFRSTRAGNGDLYQKGVSGAEEQIATSDQLKTPTSWSPDGRFLMYMTQDPATSTDLWIMDMASRKTSVFLKTPFREAYGGISPDGKWVAYQSNESGRPEVYVRPFVAPGDAGSPSAGGPWQVSTEGGISPIWQRNGRELYYINPAGAMMAVTITVKGNSIEPGVPETLFATHIFGGGIDAQQGRQYDVAPDGRFLINTVLDSATAPITLIQNWNPEAKK